MKRCKLYTPLHVAAQNNFSFSEAELSVHFDFVEAGEADYFIFPVFYEVLYEYSQQEWDERSITSSQLQTYRELFKQLEQSAENHNKKIILFYYRDPVDALPVKNALVFRTSLFRSQKNPQVFALPAFVPDIQPLLIANGSSAFLSKTDLPTVGFCGLSAPLDLPFGTRIRKQANDVFSFLGLGHPVNMHYNLGYLVRREAVLSCLSSSQVNADIIVNNTDPTHYRERFYKNLGDNAYTLCVSGHGNYSYRLYETLCAGRIPVFVDTDSVLPFSSVVDWRKHVVWVDQSDANYTAQKVREFHDALHSDDFMALQSENRALWENYVSRAGFLQHLGLYL